MASFNKTIITNNGRSLIAKVLSGDQIKFTKMVSSSRDYTSADLSQLTDLSNVEQTILISSIKKTSDSAVKITGIFSNKDLTTGYKFKTVGLYAIDPDLGEILYSVTTASSVDDMPANTGIGLSSITIGLVTEVSNSNNASLEVSDLATVSVLDFNEFKDNVHSQLNDIAINVKSIGYLAHGNGINDDTEAIQKALDYAYSIKKNVYFPSGNYRLTKIINVPPIISITGAGMDLTNFIIEHDGVGFKYICKSDTTNPTQSGGGKTCDFTIKREQPTTKIVGNHGIHLIGTFSQTLFERIKIMDMGEHGFYLYDETKIRGTGNVTFKDCYFGGNIYGYGFCAEGIFSDLLLQGVNSWGNAGSFCFDGSINNEIGFRGQNITLQGCNNEYNGGWDSASGENTMYSLLLVKNVNNVNINGLVLHSSPKQNNDISYRNHLVVDGCEHLEIDNMNIQNKIGINNGGIVLSNVNDGTIKGVTAYSSLSGGIGLLINENCKNILIDRPNLSGWGTECKIIANSNQVQVNNKGKVITLKGTTYVGNFADITNKNIDDFSPSYNKLVCDRTKYSRIANIKLTAQNGVINANFFVNTTTGSGGQYGNMLAQGILNVRVEQTEALGNNPWVGMVYIPNYSSNPANDTGKLSLTSKNFYYKITNVSANESVVEIYYKPSQAWLPLSYYPLTIYEKDGFILLLKDNGLDVSGATQGETQNKLILQSDNGSIWQIKINDNGEITTSKPSVD